MNWIEAALTTDKRDDPDFPDWPRSFYESLTIEDPLGGLAVLSSEQDPFVVKVQFKQRGRRRRQARNPQFIPHAWPGLITDVHLEAREGEEIDLMGTPDVWAYLNALTAYLATNVTTAARLDLPRRMPQQGRTTDVCYYRELLALEAKLRAQGSARPAAEIAERYSKNRATIRSHLMRARQLRDEGLL